MTTVIPLQAKANQSLTARLDGSRYDITIKTAGTVMAADIVRDGTILLSGARLVAGTPLLPYRHMQAGNFVFLTSDDAAPWWELFSTQTLVYLTAEEVAAL